MNARNFTAPLTVPVLVLLSVGPHAGSGNDPGKPGPDFSGEYVSVQMPDLLTYDELAALGASDATKPPLGARLDRMLTTPFISNEAYYNGARPLCPTVPGLGPSLRVVMWNIERGLRFDDMEALFTDREEFLKRIDTVKVPPDSTKYREVLAQIDLLQSADVLVLQEVDWGMKRTGYRATVRELGEALKMNWAFGVEFVEIDPIALGTETFDEALPEDREQMRAQIAVERHLFKGLHGTAILSRYPIKQATLRPLRVQGYDWYRNETDRVSAPEKGKRLASEKVFLEKVTREIRRGGRTLLTVTLEVPALPERELVVAAPHLENHCTPRRRAAQMQEVLSYLRAVRTPLILAGDLNTSSSDNTPTTVTREITKRVGSAEFWEKRAFAYAAGMGLLAGGLNAYKNQHDPTARHVPIVAPNPEERLFRTLESFRFDDGGAFDFRGDSQRSANGRAGTLANSNERVSKGFAATYELERSFGSFGKLKLDWIVVKPYVRDPKSDRGCYRFAPHFGRTLEEVNRSVTKRISDHNPISVDLPLNEPTLPMQGQEGADWLGSRDSSAVALRASAGSHPGGVQPAVARVTCLQAEADGWVSGIRTCASETWRFDLDSCPFAGCRRHREAARDQANPLAHTHQSEAAMPGARFRVEPASVVGDHQVQLSRPATQFDDSGARTTVLDDVLQGFLCDAVQAQRHPSGHVSGHISGAATNGNPMSRRDLGTQGAQGRGQAELCKAGGVQVV